MKRYDYSAEVWKAVEEFISAVINILTNNE